MKINNTITSSVIANSFLVNKKKNNFKSVKTTGDVFCKNNSQISFKADFNSLYCPIKKDLTTYALNSRYMSPLDIVKIIEKNMPEVTVENLKNTPADNRNNSVEAFCAKSYSFYCNPDGNIGAVINNPVIYLPLRDINSLNKGDFISTTLHEVTHALDNFSQDRRREKKFFDEHLQNKKDINETAELTRQSMELQEKLEYLIWQNFKDGLVFLLPSFLASEQIYDNTCLYAEILPASTITQKDSAEDKQFILDYLICKAQLDKDAYQSEINFAKEFGLRGVKKRAYLNQKIYDAIEKSALKIKRNLTCSQED